VIFHILTPPEWERAQQVREIAPESLAVEGFVHCSTAAQVDGVIERFYADAGELVVVEVDPELLDADLRWEPPAHPDGSADTDADAADRFPHVYGPIPLAAVVSERRT
jgi:uncharacterized protein (DUF952 family)